MYTFRKGDYVGFHVNEIKTTSYSSVVFIATGTHENEKLVVYLPGHCFDLLIKLIVNMLPSIILCLLRFSNYRLPLIIGSFLEE